MGCNCGKKRTVWNSRQAKERQDAARNGTLVASAPVEVEDNRLSTWTDPTQGYVSDNA